MDYYQQKVFSELSVWKNEMLRQPSFFNNLSKKLQTRINRWIPEKIHKAITETIKQMIRGVLFGANLLPLNALADESLYTRELAVEQRIEFYKKTAAVEGGITGAGGLLLGLADFPILIGMKIKLLFDIAALYGYDIRDYKERVYILHIFELAFSSHEHRRNVI